MVTKAEGPDTVPAHLYIGPTPVGDRCGAFVVIDNQGVAEQRVKDGACR